MKTLKQKLSANGMIGKDLKNLNRCETLLKIEGNLVPKHLRV